MLFAIPSPERYPERMSKPTKPLPAQQPEGAADYLVALAKRIETEVPEDELEALPRDGAKNHDHYLYGAPKKK